MYKSGTIYCLVTLTIFQATPFPTELDISGSSNVGIGCPKHSNLTVPSIIPQEARVRCCSKWGDCLTPQYAQNQCFSKTTFKEAEQICNSMNLRLCTPVELNNNVCCRTGCNFDNQLVWQKPKATLVSEISALKDDGEKITEMQKHGIETVEHLLTFSKKAIAGQVIGQIKDEAVTVLVDKTNKDIRDLKVAIDSLDLEKFEHTKTFIGSFNEARLNLLSVKKHLVSLSTKIVLLCKNIETNIDNWQDEYATILLKNQFTQLHRLIEETKEQIQGAKEQFDPSIIQAVSRELGTFHDTLKEALDTDSSRFKNWVSTVVQSYPRQTDIRDNKEDNEESGFKIPIFGCIYNCKSAKRPRTKPKQNQKQKPVTLGMIIADIYECNGRCSGVSKTSTLIVNKDNVRDAIQYFMGQIDMLAKKASKAKEDIDKLDYAANNLVEMTNNKIEYLSQWINEANNVEDIINGLSEDQKQAISDFQRNTLKNSVTYLKDTAQDFYDSANAKTKA